jgi:hypothetical protein
MSLEDDREHARMLLDRVEGGPRIYQRQLELCDARKHARIPGVETFLSSQ